MNRRLIWLLFVSSLGLPAATQATPHYTVQALNSGGEWTNFVPNDLNNAGQVIGTVSRPSTDPDSWLGIDRRAAVYSGGSLNVVNLQGVTASWGYALNNSGAAVVGASYDKYGSDGPLLTVRGGVASPVGTTAWFDYPTLDGANAINDSGTVVLAYSTPESPKSPILISRGYVAAAGGGILNISSGFPVTASDVNEFGTVVGTQSGWDVQTGFWAYSYSRGTIHRLGTLGYSSRAFAVNDSGVAVGASSAVQPSAANGWRAGLEHAAIFEYGLVVDLGNVGGQTRAFDINNFGEVVGSGSTYLPVEKNDGEYGLSHGTNPFLYQDGQMLMLNDLIDKDSGWALGTAIAINDAHQILAWGKAPDGSSQAALLSLSDPVSPVPEPSTFSDLLAGLVLLGATRKLRHAAG